MKTHKPIKLFVPKLAIEVIEAKVVRNKNNYYYLLHYLAITPAHNKKCKDGYVSINSDYLERVLGCKPDTYTEFLKKYDLIECDNDYIVGKKKYYYRLNPKTLLDQNQIDISPETKLFKSLLAINKKERSNVSKLPIHLYKMHNEFLKIDFDYNSAYKWISSIEDEDKKKSYIMSMEQLKDKRTRYFKRNKTNNRLDTNLTNLKKDLRRFIPKCPLEQFEKKVIILIHQFSNGHH